VEEDLRDRKVRSAKRGRAKSGDANRLSLPALSASRRLSEPASAGDRPYDLKPSVARKGNTAIGSRELLA
jgi:hypothetical protein